MTSLEDFQAYMRQFVSSDFAEASNHPYTCTCPICREWWLKMGPDDEEMFGLFGDTLTEEYDQRVEDERNYLASIEIHDTRDKLLDT